MIYLPTENDLFTFIQSSHAADRIVLNIEDIKNTWNQKIKNPYAHGHFKALMYIIHNLMGAKSGSTQVYKPVGEISIDFPAKDPAILTDIQKSEGALFWLYKLQTEIVEPLISTPILENDINAPTRLHVGQYRYIPTLAVSRPAPPVHMIPAIMHVWLKNITKYHHSIKHKIANPYGFKKEETTELLKQIKEIPLFFSTVQPFGYANQRLGRLVEFAFRLAWGLPQVYYWPDTKTHKQLIYNLQDYEENTLPIIVQKARSIK